MTSQYTEAQSADPVPFNQVSAAVQHMDSKAPSTRSVSASNRPGTVAEINQARGYQPLTWTDPIWNITWGIGCGSSTEDLGIIAGCYTVLYCVLLGIYAALLNAVLATDNTNTALWMFFGMFIFFVIVLVFSVITAGWEKDQQQKQDALNAAAMDSAAASAEA